MKSFASSLNELIKFSERKEYHATAPLLKVFPNFFTNTGSKFYLVMSLPLTPVVNAITLSHRPEVPSYLGISSILNFFGIGNSTALGFYGCWEYLSMSTPLIMGRTLGICSIRLFCSLICFCKVRVKFYKNKLPSIPEPPALELFGNSLISEFPSLELGVSMTRLALGCRVRVPVIALSVKALTSLTRLFHYLY